MTTENQRAVGDLTGDDVVTIDPETPLESVAQTLVAADIGLAVLGTPDKVVGVVSERDLVRAVAKGLDLESTPASTVASSDVVWTEASAGLDDVAELMMEQWVRHVLVEDKGRLVGIVSARDLLGALAQPSSDG